MALWNQFMLLLWKNWTLQKRKVCVTVIEILLPVFFGLILVLIRFLVKTTDYRNDTIWPSPNFTTNGLQQSYFASRHEILFAPNTTVTQEVLTVVKDLINTQHPNFTKSIKGFDTEKDLLYYHNLNPHIIWAAVVFDASKAYTSSLPNDVVYDLRVSRLQPKDRWRTGLTYPFAQRMGPRNTLADGGEPEYVKTGFIYLQYAVNMAIIKKKSGQATLYDDINMEIKKMPYPPYVDDGLLTAIQTNFPLFLMLGFILYVIQLTKTIVYEKERQLKESMKMMGLSPVVYWLSWFAISLIYLVIACIIFTILLSVKVSSHGSVLPNTNPSLTFVFLFCFATTIIALSFMISTFFSKANTALFAGGMIYFLTYFPYFFLNDDDRYGAMTQGQKILACLLSNVAMAFGIKTMAGYEGTGEGAQWSNFYKPPTVDSNISLLTCMIMMLSDTVIYLLITWYVDAVMPGEFGVPEPFYFPFTKTYWCGTNKTEKYQREVSVIAPDPAYFEKDPKDKKAGISMHHLRKVYGKGKQKKIAVRDTTLNMYEGQITALLGHNGAGKTTTMSMLTGFIPPSNGTAEVNGYDIRKDITSVRRSLGLCPQHNILFDTMTVEEHLRFFAELKGSPSKNIKKEVDDMVNVLGLESKRNKFSATLSGGQKRKLSVGIALIAGSKIVILDEPTSGMDPAARRQTWDILQKFKKDRTLVLSTHFMDEADLLGDRIAIMAEGVVKCCGTSYFLKKVYGAGYHLIMVKNKTCDVSKVTALVKSHVQTASLESEISAELSYLLPFDESAKFEKLLLEIESRSNDLGISSFGTTATTMEEVFLKVGASADIDDDNLDNGQIGSYGNPVFAEDNSEKTGVNRISNNATYTTINEGNGFAMKELVNKNFITFNKDVQKNYSLQLILQQFYGMFVKKIIHTVRNRLVSGVQLIVPVIFTIMALSIELTLPKITDEPPLILNLDLFGSGLTELYSAGKIPTNLTQEVTQRYKYKLTTRGDNPFGVNNDSTFDENILATAKSVGISTFNKRYIIGLDMEPGITTDVTAYFNGQPFHGPGISLAYTMDAMMKHAMASNDHSITTRNFPLPLSLTDNSRGIFFSTMGTGFTVAFTVIFGLATLMAVFVLKIPSLGTEDIANALDWIFAIVFPTYCLGSGIMNVYTNYGYTEGCRESGYPFICKLVPTNPCCSGCTDFCFKFQDDYLAFDYPGSGKYVIFMAVQGLVFFIILFLAESGILRGKIASISKKSKVESSYSDLGESKSGALDEDSDVRAERQRINSTDIQNLITSDSIVVKNLTKYYENFLAVDEVCISVPQQECFGLLGQNGAGKTTTFKMLTGDEIPTSGNAWLNSYDIKHEIKTVSIITYYTWSD